MAIGPAANAGDPPPFERLMRVPVTDSRQISYQGNDGDLRAVILSRLNGKRLETVRQIVAEPPRTVLGAFTTTFYDLGPGEYTLTAVDDVGNASTVPFRISDLTVSARVWPSRSNGARQSIRADAASKAGVDHFNLYSLSDPDHITVLARQDVPDPAQTGGVTFSRLAAGSYAVEAVDRYDFHVNKVLTLRPAAGNRGLDFVLGSSVALPNTPVGREVAVFPAPNLRLVFPEVFQSGETTMSDVIGTPPPGYVILQKPYAFQLASKAGYSGPVEVEFGFRQRAMHENEKENLRLFQVSDKGFTDITTSLDTKRNRIKGRLAALGTVMMAYPPASLFRTIEAPARDADLTTISVQTPSQGRLERVKWSDPSLAVFAEHARACGLTPVSDVFGIADRTIYMAGHHWRLVFDRLVLARRGPSQEADAAILSFDKTQLGLRMLAAVGTAAVTTNEFRTSGAQDSISVFTTTSAASRVFSVDFGPEAERDADGAFSVSSGTTMRLWPPPAEDNCLYVRSTLRSGLKVVSSIDGVTAPPVDLPSAPIGLPGTGEHAVSLQAEFEGQAWGKPMEFKVRVVVPEPIVPEDAN